MGKTSADRAMNVDDGMRPEYDFRSGVRGKYAEQYAQGTNVVLLDPDIAEVFRDAASVDRAPGGGGDHP